MVDNSVQPTCILTLQVAVGAAVRPPDEARLDEGADGAHARGEVVRRDVRDVADEELEGLAALEEGHGVVHDDGARVHDGAGVEVDEPVLAAAL